MMMEAMEPMVSGDAAGSGAVSDGKYRGFAPDANL